MRDLSRWLKATADETRLGLLYLLATHGELCVCDLHNALRIPQSRASRHLRTLREAKLVTDHRVGMWTHYRVVDDLPAERAAVLRSLLGALAASPRAAVLDAQLADWLERKDAGQQGACA